MAAPLRRGPGRRCWWRSGARSGGPLLLVFAAIWAVMAGLAVLDARARGRRGYVTGIASAAGGPIMVALIARSTRRQIRKAGKRLRNGLPVALLFAIAGGVIAFALGNALLDGVAFTAKAPSNALAPRIQKGDRIVISQRAAGPPVARRAGRRRAVPRCRAAARQASG